MKKVLSFVLVLAMILGSVSLVFATEFSDTKGTDYDEAAIALSDLGVISGKTSTTFAPNDNITRAEYCAMVVRALGFGQQGSATTAFEDVPASYWASGYIKTANELGVIFGRTATTFDPKANVTNDEAIAMIIRALGYKAEYLQGSYPTAHINMALSLGILEDIPTGSAAATRGTVANLVYNALDQMTVVYDANGNIIAGTILTTPTKTLLERLGGAAVNNGDEFILSGTESAKINLYPYIGRWVTALENKDGKIISVNPVSTTLTDEFEKGSAAATIAALTSDDKIGDYKIKDGAVQTGLLRADGKHFDGSAANTASILVAWFNNTRQIVAADNTYTVGGAGSDLVDGATYTFEVKIEGNYVTKIYSISEWNATAADQIDKDALEELAEDDKLLGQKFKMTNKDEIDTTKFAIYGVDSLSDIKVDNIVAVYTHPVDNNIVRVEVGTKTVTGKISKINSGNTKATIGGTVYKASALPGTQVVNYVGFNPGDDVTLWLDYNGKAYEFEKNSGTKYYGLVMAAQAGTAFADEKIKLFTQEGKKVTYVVDDDATYTNNSAAAPATTLLGDWAAGTKVNDLVEYKLNTAGEITSITKLVDAAGVGPETDYGPTITAKGTADGVIINEDTVILNVNTAAGTNYKALKRSAVLDTTVAGAGLIYGATHNGNANLFDVVLIIGTVSNADEVFYAANGYSRIDNDDYDYEWSFMSDEGKAVTILSNKDNTQLPAAAGSVNLYKLTVDGAGAATAATAVATTADTLVLDDGVNGGTAGNAITIVAPGASYKDNGTAYTFSYNDAYGAWDISLTKDVVVLVYNDDDSVWEKGSVRDLKMDAGDTFKAYNTEDSTGDYNVVLIK
jgi:hypothetical protein